MPLVQSNSFTASSTDTLTNKTITGAGNTISGITQTMVTFTTSTQTNAGTAAGTMNYISIGGIKMLWLSPTVIASGTTYTVTFPTSFFSAVPAVSYGVIGSAAATTGLYIVTATIATTGFSFYSGTNYLGVNFVVIGT